MRPLDGGHRARRRRRSPHGRPARRDHGRHRPRARGPAPHGRRAQPQHRVEHRAEVVPRPTPAGPFLRLGRIRDRAVELIQRYDVKAPGPLTPARQLSGGNLQKVVLAREFSSEPRVLVAAAPTRGLDVGAIETVHGYLREAAARRRRGAADQRGPRRGADPRRPHRRDVRGARSSARSTRAPQRRGARAADGRRPRHAARGRRERRVNLGGLRIEQRLEQRALADGRRAARLARRRAHRDRAPAAGDRASADHDAAAPLRRRLPGERRAHEHADRGDAARLHRPRRRGRVPDAAVQHRRRGPAVLRRDRRRRGGPRCSPGSRRRC